jgi:hypothetical protein
LQGIACGLGSNYGQHAVDYAQPLTLQTVSATGIFSARSMRGYGGERLPATEEFTFDDFRRLHYMGKFHIHWRRAEGVQTLVI